MVRKVSPWETNGLKEKEGTLGLRTVSKLKVASLESHAKPHPKLNEVTWAERPEEEDGFSRHVDCPWTQIEKEALIIINCQKVIGTLHDTHQRTWLQRGSCKDGKIGKVNSKEQNILETERIIIEEKARCLGIVKFEEITLSGIILGLGEA